VNTTERERQLLTLIYLLQQESEALRSVLSEFDAPKDCYVQMNRADTFRHAIEALEHAL